MRIRRLRSQGDLRPGRCRLRRADWPRRGFRRIPDPLGAAHFDRGRPGAVRLLPADRRLAAGRTRARAAGDRADRAEPAGVVRLRAGVRPGAVRAPAVLADQRSLVRVGRAGRGRGGHLRGARHRPAAAAAPAVLAGRGGGLVGPGRGGAGPVALRLSLGPAGDEPVGRAGRPLGRVRRGAAADLPDRPDRRHARAVFSRGERSPPDPPGPPSGGFPADSGPPRRPW